MDRQRLEVQLKEDRVSVIKILALNGYCTKIITVAVNGKKKTFIEYWKENDQ